MKKSLSFRSIILKNEYKALRGRNNSTIWYLLLIMYITFLCFGFSKSALDFQKKLSSNPFSNWINITYHTGNKKSLELLREVIQQDTFRTTYHIKDSYFYNMWMRKLMSNTGDTAISPFQFRSIDPKSDIINALFEPTNIIQKNFPDSSDAYTFEPNGIIVTEKLLNVLELDYRTVSFIRFKDLGLEKWVSLPVIAIVKELPDLADIVCTNTLYCKISGSGYYDLDNPQFRLFVENIEKDTIMKLYPEIINALLLEDPGYCTLDTIKTVNNRKIWLIRVDNEGEYVSSDTRMMQLEGIQALKNYHHGQYFEISPDTMCDNTGFSFENLAIEFIKLDKIREFSEYIKKEYKIHFVGIVSNHLYFRHNPQPS